MQPPISEGDNDDKELTSLIDDLSIISDTRTNILNQFENTLKELVYNSVLLPPNCLDKRLFIDTYKTAVMRYQKQAENLNAMEFSALKDYLSISITNSVIKDTINETDIITGNHDITDTVTKNTINESDIITENHDITTSNGFYIKCTHSDCNETFRSKQGLNRHLRIIHKGKPFKCMKCSARFEYGKDLTQHDKIIHKKRLNFDVLKAKLKQCPQCEFKSVITRDICYHIKRKHPYLLTVLIEKEVLKICEKCPWIYHCSEKHVCFKNSNNRSSIYDSNSNSNPVNNIQLPISHNDSTSRRIEKQPIKYPCTFSECGKSFNKSAYLIKHIRDYHKAKPYKCEYCDLSFAYKKEMRSHRIHCKLYCICRKPKRKYMIECSYCKELFHAECIGLSKQEAIAKTAYKCNACTKRKYCICKKPDDGTYMVQCNSCADWFHHTCIHLTIEDIDTLDEYNCDKCVNQAGFFSD